MKNRLITCSIISISSLLLSGCSFMEDLVNGFKTVNSISMIEEMTLAGGESRKLEYSYSPSTASIDSVSFVTDDKNVACVDEDGYVVGISVGRTKITLTILSNSKTVSASCLVNVTSEYESGKTSLNYTYDDYTDNNIYNIDSCPSIGNPKLLVIPVWFTDSKAYIRPDHKENVRQDIEKVYFGKEEDTGWNSVKTYYQYLSNNKLKLDGVVSNWYETTYSSREVKTNETTMKIVSSAVKWYFSTDNKNASRKDFDTNGDGFLDGVMLIYGAPDYGTSKSSNSNLWAYCFWMQTLNPNKYAPNENVFFWASYDFMYDNALSLVRTGYSFGGGDVSHQKLDSHTYIHEMGHVLGLDDYYDYSDDAYIAAGGFSMQDMNVGSHDPYSTLALGWSNPYIPVSSCTIKLKPFQSSNELILLSNKFNSTKSPFDEYMLLEYYTPDGLNNLDSTYTYSKNYPNGSRKSGIRLWHVDARLAQYNSYTDSFSSNLISDPTKGNVTHAMSNSYNSKDYGSVLGSKYYDYNILQLIHKNNKSNYRPTEFFSDSSLFVVNDTYKQSSYSKQFVKGSKMNNDSYLGWSFTILEMNNESITISLVKE